MKLDDKAKRWCAIAGCGLLCAVLIAVIVARFAPEAPVDELPPFSIEETVAANPVPEPHIIEIQEEKIVVSTPEPLPEEITVADAPAVSIGTEQTIQPDPVIPFEPEKPVAQGDHTNPNQQPEYIPEDTVKKSRPDTPKHGDTSGGKIYVDGFGWIDNHGGGGVGTTLDDMYENGNKIGQMG